jgi:hypothetical protein
MKHRGTRLSGDRSTAIGTAIIDYPNLRCAATMQRLNHSRKRGRLIAHRNNHHN